MVFWGPIEQHSRPKFWGPPPHKYLTLTSPIVTHDQKVSFPSPASFLSLSFIFISLSLLLFPFILPPNSCLPPPPWHCLSPLSPVPIQTLMHRHLLEGAFTFSPSPSRPSSHTPLFPSLRLFLLPIYLGHLILNMGPQYAHYH